MRFFYIESYGCASSQNNAEIIRGNLVKAGLQIVENEEIADLLIINTCVVKGPTENRILARIRELEKLDKPIIVSGCMPDVRRESLQGKNIHLLGTKHLRDILKLVRKISENTPSDFISPRKEIKLNLEKIKQNKLVGITQISEGCLGSCNYCLTKIVKGNLHSYPEPKIVKNIESDLKSGCREIWITSQDNAAYGLDSGTNLSNLLKKIIKIPGKFRVRIGMMNPNHVLPILPELIEIYLDERVYKFLHLPVQSGSNTILKNMNRKYSQEDFLKIVSKFREKIPNITLATDLIVGYPGESEQDFHETLELMRESRPDVLNFSRYWPMKGTIAAELPQVPSEISSKRAAELQQLHLKISLENNQRLEHKNLQVFVNEQEGTNCLARTPEYNLVIIKSEKNLLGKNLKVNVKKAFAHYLLAEIVT